MVQTVGESKPASLKAPLIGLFIVIKVLNIIIHKCSRFNNGKTTY